MSGVRACVRWLLPVEAEAATKKDNQNTVKAVPKPYSAHAPVCLSGKALLGW